MKIILLFALAAFAIADDDIEYYTTGNDYLDVDSVIGNPAELKHYIDCFLDKGPCNSLTITYKRNIPEAIRQACRRCNPPQKHIFWRFLVGLKAVWPQAYEDIKQKYDPDNFYMHALEQEISKY